MSQENVELVRRGYAAFFRGDLPEVYGLFSPDAVTHRASGAGRRDMARAGGDRGGAG